MKNKISYSIQYLNNFLHEHYVQLLQCIPAVVIFLLATYRLSEIGQPILFNDEIGYWSNSVFFMGDDWTSVTGRIGYYSYGYSLLLVPVRMLADLFGWGWDTLYRAAVVMNAGFLVMSYVLALKLAKRYLPDLNTVVRTVACFAIFTYSSYIVYAHITWTECTLMFFFWVFLYVMMRVVDRPGIGNHIAFAVVSFYLYTVHQRALGIVVTAMLMVVYMRLLRRNRLRDVTVFFGSMYLYSLVHAMIKGNLQNVNYLGGKPAGWSTIVGYALTKRAALLLVCGIVMLCLLWLLDRGRKKTAALLVVAGIVAVVGYFAMVRNGYLTGITGSLAGSGAGGAVDRLSTNDFSGQWRVLKNIFSLNGLIRLGISMTGKWFYLMSASGFLICWGIWGLFKNALLLLRENCRQLIAFIIPGKASQDRSDAVPEEDGISGRSCQDLVTKSDVQDDIIIERQATMTAAIWRDRIWFLGLLLAWFSTFMISAIYKEGLYKNDDLFNGRYVEFTIGFLLLYSLNCLINDKKWLLSFVVCMVLYKAAGYLCQYAVDELQRKEFELAHCVMFGRVFWNYEVPYGKVAVLWGYIRPLIIWFYAILMPARKRLSKVATARAVVVLMIPVLAWSYLGKTIVDAYVVVRNEKQAEPFVQFSDWIRVIGKGENIYYIADSPNDRNPGALQFMMADMPVTVMDRDAVSFDEDAFYIMKEYMWQAEDLAVEEQCETMMRLSNYRLVINKDKELAERWEPFRW